MPAFNMGGTAASNPSAGHAVIMSSFSGPKGSPFDAKKANPADPNGAFIADTANLSTGALSTGIGFGLDTKVPGILPIAPDFTDDYTPGVTLPGGTASPNSTLVAIGGGKSTAHSEAQGTTGIAATVPYTAGFQLLAFGNGGSRDAGAGPAFTGFPMKLVTATGAVANGAVIETGFSNRSGVGMVAGQSQFGSSAAASAAPV
jgi:hypothetical protein